MIENLKEKYRVEVMELLSNNYLNIEDHLDHIVFKKDNKKAVFHIFQSRLEYYISDEPKVEYQVSKVMIMFAIKRVLAEYYLA
jgi:hypothetical protein